MAPSQIAPPAVVKPDGVTATEIASALAIAVDTISPEFRTVSSPAPASIPTASESAVDFDAAIATPLMATATSSVGATATDVATILPSLVISSSPLATLEESSVSSSTSPSTTSILPDAYRSLPLPSPLIPMASDVAVAPPSQRPPVATARSLETEMFPVTAVESAVAIISPELKTVSLPAPASIPTARESAVAVDSAAEPPLIEIAAAIDGAVATEVATTAPVF